MFFIFFSFSWIRICTTKLCGKFTAALRRKYFSWLQTKNQTLAQKIVKSTTSPISIDKDEVFELLQNRYSGPGPYPYDSLSVFKRGMERAIEILELTKNELSGLHFLEAGCGDGMVSLALQTYGHSVSLADLEDWRDPRAKKLSFTQQNFAEGLPFYDNLFDVVFSYNSFEHFDDPEHVFNEILRVTKPSGLIYLNFGPIYASPWGLHAYRTLLMPYVQFLFSQQYIEEKLGELGINDLGKQRDKLQPLNHWKVFQFQQLWQRNNLETLIAEYPKDTSYLNLVTEYPQAFQGRGLTLDDLTTRSIKVLLRKLN